MTMALKVAPFYNTAATIAHMFDIPLPKIPASAISSLENFVSTKGSNVKGDGMQEAVELNFIESKAEEGGGQKEKNRGSCCEAHQAGGGRRGATSSR